MSFSRTKIQTITVCLPLCGKDLDLSLAVKLTCSFDRFFSSLKSRRVTHNLRKSVRSFYTVDNLLLVSLGAGVDKPVLLCIQPRFGNSISDRSSTLPFPCTISESCRCSSRFFSSSLCRDPGTELNLVSLTNAKRMLFMIILSSNFLRRFIDINDFRSSVM